MNESKIYVPRAVHRTHNVSRLQRLAIVIMPEKVFVCEYKQRWYHGISVLTYCQGAVCTDVFYCNKQEEYT